MEWAESPQLSRMYAEERCRPEHLYPSEAHFLPALARQYASLLDAGCAAGGFAAIWRHYNPALRYTGVDLSLALLEAARRRYPELDFRHGNLAEGLDLPDRCAELVAALGWLHWEPRWRAALRELWRLAGEALFFDLRLGESCQGEQRLGPDLVTPYLVVSRAEAWQLFDELAPGSREAYGYRRSPAADVVGAPHEVVMATFVLRRAPGPDRLELPE